VKRKLDLQDFIVPQLNMDEIGPSIFPGELITAIGQKKLVSQVSISEIVDRGPYKSSQVTLQSNKPNGSHLLL